MLRDNRATSTVSEVERSAIQHLGVGKKPLAEELLRNLYQRYIRKPQLGLVSKLLKVCH